MMHIIDNKRISMTEDEWNLYKSICASYDKPNFEGSELFRDHFEVNGGGIIIFVKPPHQKYSSLEVFCFLISLMVNQHIRIMHEQTEELVKEASSKITEQVQKLTEEMDKIEKLNTLIKQIEELKEQMYPKEKELEIKISDSSST